MTDQSTSNIDCTSKATSTSTRASMLRVGTALMMLGSVACGGGSAQTAPTVTPANYSYSMPTTLERNEVPLAVMHATAADGLDTSARGVAFRTALAQGFFELLVNKGFGATGPYTTVDEMTFPEKRAVSLLITPEFNTSIQMTPSNVRTSSWSGTTTCDISFRVQGSVTIIAVEPLSGQRMFNRRVELTPAEHLASDVADVVWCSGRTDDQPVPAVANALERMYERLYAETMAAVDRYITPEEFTVLNGEVQRLREQTSFSGAR